MLVVLQLLLLLCVGSSTVNINVQIPELEKLQQMEEKIQTLQETLNKVLSEHEARKIAFSAGLLASGSKYIGPFDDAWKTLVYKKVYSNIGNAYDSNTGIFTAPVKGAYYFGFYIHTRAKINLGAGLFKNDVPQCSVFSAKPTVQSNASNGVVLTLEPGDQVHIKLWKYAQVYDDKSSYTSFSGFLLFPL
ncbi:complement C1q-like protein 3 [Misgurnus anguillicaudatus]|uniref:complement C1q-like protein 3 n=1 Tax=Misgurnus anguillicaudatus TaxID=75329 RepID=UPI003CCFA4C6